MEKILLEEAIKLLDGEMTRVRLVAMLIDGDKIVSHAYNAGMRHAETSCFHHTNFRKLPKYKKYNLFVVRLTIDNKVSCAKPCKHCLNVLKKNNKISKIMYTNSNGEIVIEKLDEITNDFITMGNRLKYREWRAKNGDGIMEVGPV